MASDDDETPPRSVPAKGKGVVAAKVRGKREVELSHRQFLSFSHAL